MTTIYIELPNGTEVAVSTHSEPGRESAEHDLAELLSEEWER